MMDSQDFSLSEYCEVLTPGEVQEILYICKNTFYKFVNQGVLKGVRLGRQWRVPKRAVLDFLKESRT